MTLLQTMALPLNYLPLSQCNSNLVTNSSEKHSPLTQQINIQNTKLTLTAGSRLIHCDNTTIWLHAPALASNGFWMVSSADVNSILRPILFQKIAQPPEIFEVILDAGHGGEDGGAPSPGGFIHEKQLTLQIALQVRDILKKSDIQVRLTRETDKTTSLATRCNTVSSNTSLFVSIHVNSAANEVARGFETFTIPHAGFAATMNSNFATTNFTGNCNNSDNNLAAFLIQNELAGLKLTSDRGVRHARYYVLREASCPAILVECGFITNLHDARMLCDEKDLLSISESIAKGILKYATLNHAKKKSE